MCIGWHKPVAVEISLVAYRALDAEPILTLSLTSDRWGHSVTPNNSLKSWLNVFKFYILVKDHMLDSLWVFLQSENGILLYV